MTFLKREWRRSNIIIAIAIGAWIGAIIMGCLGHLS